MAIATKEATQYVAARNGDEAERERLRILEEISDPWTFERMAALGVGPGWRCLEVGAGGGSVARWLADRTGPTGRVVATDLDPRFLSDLDGVEVRRHDIVTDELEENAFDVVHCRALLLHIPERRRALERMYAAVAPDGWLFVEDLDVSTIRAADPTHPEAAEFDRLQRTTIRFFASLGIFDPSNGRRLRSQMAALDLEQIGQSASTSVLNGGEPAAHFLALGARMTRELLVSQGVASEAELDAQIRRMDDPGFSFTDVVAYRCWGRKPA